MTLAQSRRAAIGAAGLVLANIGFVIPWNLTPNADNRSSTFGIDQTGVALSVWFIFMMLAAALVVGMMSNVTLLRWAAQLSAGMWCSVGSLYILAGDPGLGVLCLGIAVMALGIDWVCNRRVDDEVAAAAGL